MDEYRRQENNFIRHTGSAFTFGEKESRKIIANIVKSGKVYVDEGSLEKGLRLIDRVARVVRPQ